MYGVRRHGALRVLRLNSIRPRVRLTEHRYASYVTAI